MKSEQKIFEEQLRAMSLPVKIKLLVALVRSISKEVKAKNLLPPGPVAHISNLGYEVFQLQRVLQNKYNNTESPDYEMPN